MNNANNSPLNRTELPFRKTLSVPYLINEIVINFHIIEHCNYKCEFCYAHWTKKSYPELRRNTKQISRLLDSLARYFHSSNSELSKTLKWEKVRLSFAGGEPTTVKKIGSYIDLAKQKGFEVSIITNGSLLSDNFLEQYGGSISILGLSIDSVQPNIQREIGRVDNKGRTLNINDFSKVVDKYLKVNPSGVIKINTVVNRFNYNDDMSTLIDKVRPNKWKVLKVLPYKGYPELEDGFFQHFLNNHRQFSSIISKEDNNDMTDSYLMINPHGCFFQNSDTRTGGEYKESKPILDVGVETALKQIKFNPYKFVKRYA